MTRSLNGGMFTKMLVKKIRVRISPVRIIPGTEDSLFYGKTG
jgi:hypothetical protein